MGIFPNSDAVLRLAGSALIEIHEKWQTGRRYFNLKSKRKLKLKAPIEEPMALPGPFVPGVCGPASGGKTNLV